MIHGCCVFVQVTHNMSVHFFNKEWDYLKLALDGHQAPKEIGDFFHNRSGYQHIEVSEIIFLAKAEIFIADIAPANNGQLIVSNKNPDCSPGWISANLEATSANAPLSVGGSEWTLGVGGGGYCNVAQPVMISRLTIRIFAMFLCMECLCSLIGVGKPIMCIVGPKNRPPISNWYGVFFGSTEKYGREAKGSASNCERNFDWWSNRDSQTFDPLAELNHNRKPNIGVNIPGFLLRSRSPQSVAGECVPSPAGSGATSEWD